MPESAGTRGKSSAARFAAGWLSHDWHYLGLERCSRTPYGRLHRQCQVASAASLGKR